MLTLLALLASAVASVKAGDPALLVHIAFAGMDTDGYPNAMSMMWQTKNSTATSVCKYSTSPDLSNAVTVTGSESSYYQSWQHKAQTNALAASTTYYYSCGDATAGMSPVFNFTSPQGASQEKITVLQVGDLGVYESYYTRQLIGELAPSADFLMWSGDICYADDAFLHDPVGFGYEETYDVCQLWLSNTTSHTPFMVAPGNHEAECHSPACLLDDERKEKLHNFSAYTHRFDMPSAVSHAGPGVLNQWFSYQLGPVFFIHMDSETSFPGAPGDSYTGLPNGNFGDQVAWVTATLKFANSTAQRAKTPWIVATTHRPFYSLDDSSESGEPGGAAVKEFEELFYEYGVDVHLSGHVHAYERQKPVFKNQLNPKATTYIVSGAGGNTEEHSDLHSKPGVIWNAYFNTDDYGIGRFTANATRFSWEFLRGTDGEVLDSVTLYK